MPVDQEIGRENSKKLDFSYKV